VNDIVHKYIFPVEYVVGYARQTSTTQALRITNCKNVCWIFLERSFMLMQA